MDLPSLWALAAFEAPRRHRSFIEALRELGVSRSAVSHHVAWLEAGLGRPRFRLAFILSRLDNPARHDRMRATGAFSMARHGRAS